MEPTEQKKMYNESIRWNCSLSKEIPIDVNYYEETHREKKGSDRQMKKANHKNQLNRATE